MTLVQDLPEWLEQGSESSLRDTEDDTQPPVQVTTARSIASTSHGPIPIILTPTGRHSPATAGSSPAPWTDLDKFYADVEVTEGGGDDDGTDDSDDDGETSDVSEEGDVEGGSGDEESPSESEGSTSGKGTPGGNLRGLI